MKYDVAVIGAGPGGYSLALECGRRKMRTVLIEKTENLGGTCLNIGCIPSKALLESSELFYKVRNHGQSHGVLVNSSDVGLDLKQMMGRKDSVVRKLTGGLEVLVKARNVDVIRAEAFLKAPGILTIQKEGAKGQKEEIEAPNIVLATGSQPTALPGLNFDGKLVVDSTDALSFTSVPGSLAVIGAGALGLELGSVWSRLGSEVTVIEAADRIVPGTDAQASKSLATALKAQGIKILCSTMVSGAKMGTRNVSLELKTAPGKEIGKIKADKLLVSIGRNANIDSAFEDGIKPEKTGDGRFIRVDDGFRTSIPGVFAIGDLIGNPMLAHKAEEEALALACLLAGENLPPWGGPIPNIVYTEPELAWAGETEESLIQSGHPYIKGYFPFASNGRAIACGYTSGFVKLLSSPEDSRLIGAVILSHGASELIGEAVSVMAMGGCAEDLALTVHGHPTFSEALKEAAMDLVSRPLHKAN